MKSLFDLHVERHARMGVYNNKAVPSAYNEPDMEYKAVREHALLIDYSHMAIVSIAGDYALELVNYIASADMTIVHQHQGAYSLVLFEDGSIHGDIYVITARGCFYILSESLSVFDIIDCLNKILESAEAHGIKEIPEIEFMEEDDWGVIMLEGPWSWEIMAEAYGAAILSLQCYEYLIGEDDLIVFRCCKHGEFAYMVIGQQTDLFQRWQDLLVRGKRYFITTGGLDYQHIVRIENVGWDENIYGDFSRNPAELQLQWAIHHNKKEFLGKDATEHRLLAKRQLVGMLLEEGHPWVTSNHKIQVDNKDIGVVIKAVYSPGLHAYIALALIDRDYTRWSDALFSIPTRQGRIAAKIHIMPFVYNLSWFIHPQIDSFIDVAESRQ